MDLAATGESVTVTGISFIHIEDGRIVEVYNNHDRLGLLEQLDAIPDSPRRSWDSCSANSGAVSPTGRTPTVRLRTAF